MYILQAVTSYEPQHKTRECASQSIAISVHKSSKHILQNMLYIDSKTESNKFTLSKLVSMQ